MKPLYLLLVALLSLQAGFAQDKPKEHPFLIKGIVYTSDSTGAGYAVYRGDKCGVVFVNDKGIVEQEVPVPGHVQGIAKWKGNVLCYYTDGWYMKLDKEVHIVLIDIATKALVSDKLVYSNTGGKQIECIAGNDDLGNFNYLFIRTSDYSGNANKLFVGNKDETDLQSTMTLTAISLNDASEPVQQKLSTAAVGGVLLGIYMNRVGEIAVVSEKNDQLIAEKFGRDGHLQKKIAIPLEFPDIDNSSSWYSRRIGSFNPSANDVLGFCIVNKDHRGKNPALSVVIFDFAKGKARTQGTAALDKDYFRDLKSQGDMKHSAEFKGVEHFVPDGLLFFGDKLAVCNDVQFAGSGGDGSNAGSYHIYYDEGAVLSIYDNQAKLLNVALIDKDFRPFADDGRGLSYHLQEGKLYIFGNELKGMGSIASFCYIYDTETRLIEKTLPDRVKSLSMTPISPKTIFWFKQSIVVSYAIRILAARNLNSCIVATDYPKHLR